MARRRQRREARRAGAHWAVFLGLAGAIVVLDQLTKAWLVANVAPGEVVEVIGDCVRLVFGQNSGRPVRPVPRPGAPVRARRRSA